MKLIQEYTGQCLKTARVQILTQAVQYPILAMTLVILFTTLLLPLVSATALMPVVAFLHVSDYLQSKGLLSVVYNICAQGFLLGALLLFLYLIFFTMASAVNILHCKRFSTRQIEYNTQYRQ